MNNGGYFVKYVVSRPEWLDADVAAICSVSNCISQPPEGWVEHWLHNGLGWFNRISDARQLIPADGHGTCRLFAYRLYDEFFREGRGRPVVVPADVTPDPLPETFKSLGFDAVSKSLESILGFECSPLSCNSMAAELRTNEHCLFESLDAAIDGATRFSREQPEPGDYYVIEVLEERGALKSY